MKVICVAAAAAFFSAWMTFSGANAGEATAPDPVKDQAKDPAKPAVADTVKSAAIEPSKDPAKPAVVDTAKSAVVDPAKSAVVDPAKPVVVDPAKPAVAAPAVVPAAPDAFALPANATTKSLMEFLTAIDRMQPVSQEEFEKNKVKARDAIKAACEQILMLEKGDMTDDGHYARRRILFLTLRDAGSPTEPAGQKALEDMLQFLAGPKYTGEDIEFALSLARRLEIDNPKRAGEFYFALSQTYEKSTDPRTMELGKELKLAAQHFGYTEPAKPAVVADPAKPAVVADPNKAAVVADPAKPPVVADPAKPAVVTDPAKSAAVDQSKSAVVDPAKDSAKEPVKDAVK